MKLWMNVNGGREIEEKENFDRKRKVVRPLQALIP